MTSSRPVLTDMGPTTSGVHRKVRDADSTRKRLLQAAQRRFARDGYDGTTVRDIATDAGVNVALINRYFTSKEGLFEACLRRVDRSLEDPSPEQVSVAELVQILVGQLTDLSGTDVPLDLLLLLRSSGNARADSIRSDILRSFAESIAAVSGKIPDEQIAPDESVLLRAEIVLAASLGILLIRSTTHLQPLVSATADDLAGPVRLIVSSLLDQRSGNG